MVNLLKWEVNYRTEFSVLLSNERNCYSFNSEFLQVTIIHSSDDLFFFFASALSHLTLLFCVLASSSSSSSFFFFFCFLEPHSRDMEVPRLGVEWELQLPAYTTATAK